MTQMRKREVSFAHIHNFSTCGAVPEELITIKLTDGSGFFAMEVYDNTPLFFVFNYAFAHMHCTCELLNATRGPDLRDFPGLCLHNLAEDNS